MSDNIESNDDSDYLPDKTDKVNSKRKKRLISPKKKKIKLLPNESYQEYLNAMINWSNMSKWTKNELITFLHDNGISNESLNIIAQSKLRGPFDMCQYGHETLYWCRQFNIRCMKDIKKINKSFNILKKSNKNHDISQVKNKKNNSIPNNEHIFDITCVPKFNTTDDVYKYIKDMPVSYHKHIVTILDTMVNYVYSRWQVESIPNLEWLVLHGTNDNHYLNRKTFRDQQIKNNGITNTSMEVNWKSVKLLVMFLYPNLVSKVTDGMFRVRWVTFAADTFQVSNIPAVYGDIVCVRWVSRQISKLAKCRKKINIKLEYNVNNNNNNHNSNNNNINDDYDILNDMDGVYNCGINSIDDNDNTIKSVDNTKVCGQQLDDGYYVIELEMAQEWISVNKDASFMKWFLKNYKLKEGGFVTHKLFPSNIWWYYSVNKSYNDLNDMPPKMNSTRLDSNKQINIILNNENKENTFIDIISDTDNNDVNNKDIKQQNNNGKNKVLKPKDINENNDEDIDLENDNQHDFASFFDFLDAQDNKKGKKKSFDKDWVTEMVSTRFANGCNLLDILKNVTNAVPVVRDVKRKLEEFIVEIYRRNWLIFNEHKKVDYPDWFDIKKEVKHVIDGLKNNSEYDDYKGPMLAQTVTKFISQKNGLKYAESDIRLIKGYVFSQLKAEGLNIFIDKINNNDKINNKIIPKDNLKDLKHNKPKQYIKGLPITIDDDIDLDMNNNGNKVNKKNKEKPPNQPQFFNINDDFQDINGSDNDIEFLSPKKVANPFDPKVYEFLIRILGYIVNQRNDLLPAWINRLRKNHSGTVYLVKSIYQALMGEENVTLNEMTEAQIVFENYLQKRVKGLKPQLLPILWSFSMKKKIYDNNGHIVAIKDKLNGQLKSINGDDIDISDLVGAKFDQKTKSIINAKNADNIVIKKYKNDEYFAISKYYNGANDVTSLRKEIGRLLKTKDKLENALQNMDQWHEVYIQCSKPRLIDVVLYHVLHHKEKALQALPDLSVNVKDIPEYGIKDILGVDVPGLTDMIEEKNDLNEVDEAIKYFDKYPKVKQYIQALHDDGDDIMTKHLKKMWKMMYKKQKFSKKEKKLKSKELKRYAQNYYDYISDQESSDFNDSNDDNETNKSGSIISDFDEEDNNIQPGQPRRIRDDSDSNDENKKVQDNNISTQQTDVQS